MLIFKTGVENKNNIKCYKQDNLCKQNIKKKY